MSLSLPLCVSHPGVVPSPPPPPSPLLAPLPFSILSQSSQLALPHTTIHSISPILTTPLLLHPLLPSSFLVPSSLPPLLRPPPLVPSILLPPSSSPPPSPGLGLSSASNLMNERGNSHCRPSLLPSRGGCGGGGGGRGRARSSGGRRESGGA